MSINYSIRKGFIPNERWITRQKTYNYNGFLDDWKDGKVKSYLKYKCKKYRLYHEKQIIADFDTNKIIIYVDISHINLIKRIITGITERKNGFYYNSKLLNSGDTIFINL